MKTNSLGYPEREIEVIPECNDDNDNPTCWSMKYWLYGDTYDWLYICKYGEKDYRCEDADGLEVAEHTYKTLAGAKKYLEGVCWRRENS